MAAAMGFSSFGSAPAKKKRKFNAATDAFVEGQALEDIDRGGKKGKGSGGNSVALGKTRVLGGGDGSNGDGGQTQNGNANGGKSDGVNMRPVENEAEIELEEGGDGSEEERPNYVDTSLPAPAEQEIGLRGGQGQGEEEEGPAYIDTSLPPPSTGKGKEKETQEKIDSILTSKQSQVQGLPARPQPFHIEPRSRVPLRNLPPGTRIPSVRTGANRWWEGYYDQSFNTNPWEHCEKEKGLSAVGSWLMYGHYKLGVGKVEPPLTPSGKPQITADGQ